MAYGLSCVQLADGSVNLTKLPLLLLDVRCDGLGRQKGLGPLRLPGKCIQTLFGCRVEPDGKSLCHHLYALVHNLTQQAIEPLVES
jgi:hypothetical protein